MAPENAHQDDDSAQRQLDSAPVTYANHITMRSGVYDVVLTFGVDFGEGVQPTAIIAMSPQHARSLKLLLDRYIADYERRIGSIALPERIVRNLTTLEPDDEDDESGPAPPKDVS